MSDLLRVNELFGPTLQGEGPWQGQQAWFMRMSGCNLNCSWCDTPYTWDWEGQNGTPYNWAKETYEMGDQQIRNQLADLGWQPGDTIILTGGEPLLQQRNLTRWFDKHPARVQVETNGTITPRDGLIQQVALWVVSPKLTNSGISRDRREKPKPIQRFANLNTAWKFVVCQPGDVVEVDEFVDRYHLDPRTVWLMPEGVSRETLNDRTGWVFDVAADRGWQMTTRLHILAHGARRKV